MQDEIMTYVYDGKEVRPTGRIAERKGKPILIEVVPLGATPDDKAYAKWVRTDELYIIKQTEQEEDIFDETERD